MTCIPAGKQIRGPAILLQTLPNGSRNETSDLYGFSIEHHAVGRSIKQDHGHDPINFLNRIVAVLVCLIVGAFIFSLVFVF